MTKTAQDIMTTGVLTAGSHWPVEQLAGFLNEKAISAAPVVGTEGELVGVVSVTDVVRYASKLTREGAKETAHDYYTSSVVTEYSNEDLASFHIEETSETVAGIMTPVVFDVQPSTTAKEIAKMMTERRIHRVFVTESRKIVGVVSALDLLELL